jgi:uncharacterized membrane protein YgaE (UPF0421/DUF939 family)
MTHVYSSRLTARRALDRLRGRAWPILQTAVAAVAAWYLAKLLLDVQSPVFASIAAVIALGATYGQRPERAIELIGGVVLGIGVADLLIVAIGTGPIQLGLLVVLAMSVAVILGGGPVLVTEAAVSAILLSLIEPSSAGLPPSRLLEALVGGGVALGISALAFPLNPILLVGRSTQSIFGELGRTMEDLAMALSERDGARAEAALQSSREIDDGVRELEDSLTVARETARFSPGRRSSRGELERYGRGLRHIDFAVRNTRVLARHVGRYLRGGGEAPAELADAVQALGYGVWALAAEFDDVAPDSREVRRHASSAAALATQSFEGDPDLGLAEIVAQVRSTAIDLVRAAEAAARVEGVAEEHPTEELLIDLVRAQDRNAA